MSNSEEDKVNVLVSDNAIPSIKLPEFSQSINYYKEYWRIYLENERLLAIMQESQNECLDFQRKINAIQVKFGMLKFRSTITHMHIIYRLEEESTLEDVQKKLTRFLLALIKAARNIMDLKAH